MAYIGFDLDETLGRFGVVDFPTSFLQPHLSLYGGAWSGKYDARTKVPEPIPLSSSLRQALDTAFSIFMDCLAEKEKEGLGILRPNIVEIARRLYLQKQMSPPLVKSVVIYSNNGNLVSLLFAAGLIERLADAPGLFCNFLHWYHPSRENEIVKTSPGTGRKLLTTLINSFYGGSCRSDTISVQDIYFVDDQIHPDIKNRIGDRYIQIPAYKKDADTNVILECFKRAFLEAKLDTNEEYFAYLKPIFKGENTLEKAISIIQDDYASNPGKSIVPNNTAFLKQFGQRLPIPIQQANFTKALRTFHKLEQKKNEGLRLNNTERLAYVNAKIMIENFENQTGGKRSRKTRRQTKRRKN